MAGRHDCFGHVVQRIEAGELEDCMFAAAGQRLDETRGRHQPAAFVFRFTRAVRTNADGVPLIDTRPSCSEMWSPGRPMTRFTQICERSPGQRNTTTSPRFGNAPRMCGVFGNTMKFGSDAEP